MSNNAVLSRIFGQMADIMEILGDDRFRINTYRRVARVIADSPTDVADLFDSGDLAKIDGIGKSSLAKIRQFLETGGVKAHQDLLDRIPPTLLDLLDIPGMGPKSAKAVYEQLNVTSVEELRTALEAGHVAELSGFGEKKSAQLLKGIEFLETATDRLYIDQAVDAAHIVITFLRQLKTVKKIIAAGSLRRFRETIGDVDILVAASDKHAPDIVTAFVEAPFVIEPLASGPTKGSARIRTEERPVQVDVRVVPLESFGAAAQYFTGSQDHNVRLREIAVKASLKLNEYGLYDGDKMIAGKNERDIYTALGLDHIPPALREDRGEIAAALEHRLPNIVTEKDIRGDLHMHTTASDGDDEIEDMARMALELGYKFICITDHSQSSAIANGLSERRLLEHIEKIHRLDDRLDDITIFAGIELDILADGSLDFDDSILAQLDYVVASIHSALASDREKVTMRTLKAMDNPYVNCIGHPTARLLNIRQAMDLDIEAVVAHAAETGTALEVNANPYRLDLKDTHCRLAVEAGAKLAVGTDAHTTEGLTLMTFGVATAARGWATKADLLNCMTVRQLKSFIKKKRP